MAHLAGDPVRAAALPGVELGVRELDELGAAGPQDQLVGTVRRLGKARPRQDECRGEDHYRDDDCVM